MLASSLVLTAVILSGIRPKAAYAVEGWAKQGEEWVYLDRKDIPVTNAWEKSKDAWYYLGPDGRMVKDGFVGQGAALYHVDKEGKRMESGWVQNKKDDGLGHQPGWYYFGSDGTAYHRSSSQFLKKIDGKAYAFDENGLMLTGWLDQGGNPVDKDSNPLETGEYYSGGDGALKTESWLDFSSLGEWDADGLSSSVTGRDYSDYDKLWLYFDQNSKKVKTANDQIKQKTIGGSVYGFDEYGIMLPWWSRVGTVSDADKVPTTDVAPRFYAGYDGGKLLKNQWVWMYPSEDLLKADFTDQEYSWWRTDSQGKVYQNGIKAVNGRHYAFDGIGRMRTGFNLFDGRSKFVAQYDSGAWSSDDFKYGNVYGDEKADLYFFSPDELNDGSMQTGDDIQIELSDGVYTFGFGKDGIAYGSRNTTQRKNDRYYRNGLRMEADGEYGYGVVQILTRQGADESDPADDVYEYRVVNADGTLITGKKKVVKDKMGGWIIILNGRYAARVEDEDKPVWHDGPEGAGFYHYDRKAAGSDKYQGKITDYSMIPTHSYADELTSFQDLPSDEMLNFGH